MASPTIRSYSSGYLGSDASYQREITMPSSIEAGDVLICFVATSPLAFCYPVKTNSSENWMHYRTYLPQVNFDIGMNIFMAVAYGGLIDWLTIKSYWGSSDYGSWYGPYGTRPNQVWVDSLQARYTKIAYICYAISGAHRSISTAHASYGSAGNTGMWDTDPIPKADDSVVNDYLWLLGAAATLDHIATGAPTDFTNLHTVTGDSTGYYPCSISTCQRATTGISQLNPGSFTAPLCQWTIVGIRVTPTGGTPPGNPVISGGIGMYLHNENIEVYTGLERIEVNPVDMYFNSDGSENGNPFQTYIELYCSASWTASWLNDLHFDAGSYSGDAGVNYIAITCKGENTSGDPYLDTLTVQSGLSSDTMYVQQASA